MDKLRVSTNTRKIEVNEEGEFIVLNFDDQAFLPGLAAVIEDFESKLPEYEKMAAELDALPASTPEEKMAKMRKSMEFNLDIHNTLKDRINSVFRDDVCRKVFGDIVPPVDYYAEFFGQLTPFVEKYAKERAAKMQKYSAARMGNV